MDPSSTSLGPLDFRNKNTSGPESRIVPMDAPGELQVAELTSRPDFLVQMAEVPDICYRVADVQVVVQM
jgi:hypothetical protein